MPFLSIVREKFVAFVGEIILLSAWFDKMAVARHYSEILSNWLENNVKLTTVANLNVHTIAKKKPRRTHHAVIFGIKMIRPRVCPHMSHFSHFRASIVWDKIRAKCLWSFSQRCKHEERKGRAQLISLYASRLKNAQKKLNSIEIAILAGLKIRVL